MPDGRFSGVHVKAPLVPLEVMVWTSLRLPDSPFFSLMVTGSTASSHLMVKGTPSVIVYCSLMSLTASVRTARALTRRAAENFMLTAGIRVD